MECCRVDSGFGTYGIGRYRMESETNCPKHVLMLGWPASSALGGGVGAVCGSLVRELSTAEIEVFVSIIIDENIDMVEAKKVTDKYNKVLSGNIQLTVCMLLGNQKDCQKSALEKIDQMGDQNFILAPGCDMPYDTPSENIIGIGQAVHDVESTRKFLETYIREDLDMEVEMPDYKNLDECYYYIGLCYEKTDKVEKSIEAYEQYLAMWPKGSFAPISSKRISSLKANLIEE